jgi:hypothetical protein
MGSFMGNTSRSSRKKSATGSPAKKFSGCQDVVNTSRSSTGDNNAKSMAAALLS